MTNIREQNMQDIAQEAIEQMYDANMTAVSESIDKAFNSLVGNLYSEINRLPEKVFVEVFLPFFAGIKDVKQYENFFRDWISIAGAPTLEVMIVDSSGKELYRVPPIMDTSVVSVTRSEKEANYNQIFDEFELRNRQLPVVGQNFIAKAMANKANTVLDASKPNSHLTKWKNIFDRYNIEMPKAVKTTAVSNSVDSDDDELVYD